MTQQTYCLRSYAYWLATNARETCYLSHWRAQSGPIYLKHIGFLGTWMGNVIRYWLAVQIRVLSIRICVSLNEWHDMIWLHHRFIKVDGFFPATLGSMTTIISRVLWTEISWFSRPEMAECFMERNFKCFPVGDSGGVPSIETRNCRLSGF